MTAEIEVETVDRQCRITFARPDERNMLTLAGIEALAAAIAEAGRDPAVKVIRLRASGPVFCGGRAPAPPSASPLSTAQFRTQVADPILSVYQAMHASEVPVLAEVQGDASGFGCALVVAADLAIAAAGARFDLPEMKKNLPPTLVLSVLRSKVSPKASAHLAYLGLSIDAPQALEWGLVAEVLANDAFDARATAIVDWLCGRDRLALATIKTYFRELMVPDFALGREMAGSLLSGAMTSMAAR